MASGSQNMATYLGITSENLRERQFNNTDIVTWVNTNANIHRGGLQGDFSVQRFFASDGNDPGSTYNLPVVDSHNMIFGIDNGNSWNRILCLDIRSTAIYTKAKTNGTWSAWRGLVTSTANTAVGGATNPIYINSSGEAVAMTAGTNGQFYRGDKTWSNDLVGRLTVDGLSTSADIIFDATSTTGTSSKITWSGSTDAADIYYYVPSSDQGNLVINTRDDTNCLVAFAYNGSIKAYMNNSTPCFYPATNKSGNIGDSSYRWSSISTENLYAYTDLWGDQIRLVDDWIGFYAASVNSATRRGYIQCNADRMYFRKENGTSTYAFDFAGTLYNSERIFIGYKSGTWVNSLTNSAITITDAAGSYGGWICGPTKDGRITISTYQNSSNSIYLGYGERGRTTNSFAQSITWDGPNNILYTNRVDMAWLRVVNDSSNNSDDATVYIQCKTANDWAVKINKGGNRYGLYIDSLDQDDAIRTNGYIRARCVWANQGSNGERQIGTDSSTSGTIYFWSNTGEKGIYSSTGYRTGYVVRLASNATYFYGDGSDWFECSSNQWRIRSNNVVDFLTTSGGAQNARMGKLGLSSSYASINFGYTLHVVGNAYITTTLTVGSTMSAYNVSVTGGGNLDIGSTSGNDQGDIVWWHSNGNESVRIWTGSGFSGAQGPLYRCFNSGGTLLYSGTLVYGSGSSRTIKHNIHSIMDVDALKILQLRPVEFEYNQGCGPNGMQAGLISEEAFPFFPYVTYDIPMYMDKDVSNPSQIVKGIYYDKLVPYLIKLAQIQQKEINQLRNELNSLKSNI